MAIVTKMVYVNKADPTIRYYDESSLRTFVAAAPLVRERVLWDVVYEVFDDAADSTIHTSLNLAFTPKAVIPYPTNFSEMNGRPNLTEYVSNTSVVSQSVAGPLVWAGTQTFNNSVSISSNSTTGQPQFLSLSNSTTDLIALRYTEQTIGSIPSDSWQLRLGGTTSRPLVISSFDSTAIATFSSTSVGIGVGLNVTGASTLGSLSAQSLTVSGNTTLGDASNDTLVINPSDISIANIPAGTIAAASNLGIDSNGKLVKAAVSGGGGGGDSIKVTQSIDIPGLGANTSSSSNVTVAGAVVGDPVLVTPPPTMSDGIVIWAAYVSAADTVTIKFRNISGGYLDPTAANFSVVVIKDSSVSSGSYSDFTTSTSGLVPAPVSSSGRFLRDDGSWAAASGGGGSSLVVKNDGINLTTAATSLNFADGSTATLSGSDVTVSVNPLSGAWLYDEFLDYVAGDRLFNASVISTGTIAISTAILDDGNHPGIARISSSATANSGGRLSTNNTAILLKSGYRFRSCIRLPSITTSTIRIGFMDATSSTDAVDGVYFEILNGVARLKTSNNSTRTTDTLSTTLSTNTWYELRLGITGSGAQGYILSDTGTVLYTSTLINTNIPTGAGRQTGCGAIYTNSGTVATEGLQIDYMGVRLPPSSTTYRQPWN